MFRDNGQVIPSIFQMLFWFTPIDVILIEVQVGEYTGQDDIARFEYDFQRV